MLSPSAVVAIWAIEYWLTLLLLRMTITKRNSCIWLHSTISIQHGDKLFRTYWPSRWWAKSNRDSIQSRRFKSNIAWLDRLPCDSTHDSEFLTTFFKRHSNNTVWSKLATFFTILEFTFPRFSYSSIYANLAWSGFLDGTDANNG